MPEAASRWTTSGSSSGAAPAGPDEASDPFGVRSHYALRLGDGVHTAADPRALRRLPGAPRGVDPAALHGYLCFSHPPGPRTLFAGIGRTPAPAPWREAPAPADEDSAVRSLRALLAASVERMLGAERD